MYAYNGMSVLFEGSHQGPSGMSPRNAAAVERQRQGVGWRGRLINWRQRPNEPPQAVFVRSSPKHETMNDPPVSWQPYCWNIFLRDKNLQTSETDDRGRAEGLSWKGSGAVFKKEKSSSHDFYSTKPPLSSTVQPSSSTITVKCGKKFLGNIFKCRVFKSSSVVLIQTWTTSSTTTSMRKFWQRSTPPSSKSSEILLMPLLR